MIAAIRRFRLVVISLAIIGLAAGFGLSGSRHHVGYQSKSVIVLVRLPVHWARKEIGSAVFWHSVAGQRPYQMNGTPGWIVLPGKANELKSQITTVQVSGRMFDIVATEPTQRQAVYMVRSVTEDFDLFIRNASRETRILTWATKPVAIGSSSSSTPSAVEYGSIGFGAGLGVGLLLASALAAFPGRRPESAAE